MKKWLSLLSIFLCFIMLFACKAPDNPENAKQSPEIATDSSRQIIYTYNTDIYVDDIDELINTVKSDIKAYTGAYISNSKHNDDNYAYYVLRIPAQSLEEFTDSLKNYGTLKNSSLSSDDVTKEYVDLTIKLTSRELELSRTLELYDLATTIDQMLEINARVYSLENEIEQLKSSIKSYDEDVAFSTVQLNIFTNNNASEEKASFGTKLLNTLKNSGKAVLAFLQILLFAIIYVGPFALMGLGVFLIVYFILKHLKKRKDKSKSDTDNNE